MSFLSYQVSNSVAIRNTELRIFMMAELDDDLKLFNNNYRDTQNETT